jgi:hypothetical protein
MYNLGGSMWKAPCLFTAHERQGLLSFGKSRASSS